MSDNLKITHARVRDAANHQQDRAASAQDIEQFQAALKPIKNQSSNRQSNQKVIEEPNSNEAIPTGISGEIAALLNEPVQTIKDRPLEPPIEGKMKSEEPSSAVTLPANDSRKFNLKSDGEIKLSPNTSEAGGKRTDPKVNNLGNNVAPVSNLAGGETHTPGISKSISTPLMAQRHPSDAPPAQREATVIPKVAATQGPPGKITTSQEAPTAAGKITTSQEAPTAAGKITTSQDAPTAAGKITTSQEAPTAAGKITTSQEAPTAEGRITTTQEATTPQGITTNAQGATTTQAVAGTPAAQTFDPAMQKIVDRLQTEINQLGDRKEAHLFLSGKLGTLEVHLTTNGQQLQIDFLSSEKQGILLQENRQLLQQRLQQCCPEQSLAMNFSSDQHSGQEHRSSQYQHALDAWLAGADSAMD